MGELRHKYSVWLNEEERKKARFLEKLYGLTFSAITRMLLIERAEKEGYPWRFGTKRLDNGKTAKTKRK